MKKSVVETPSKGSLTPLKRSWSGNPPAEGIKNFKKEENLNDVEEVRKMDQQQWVTVYGFNPIDVKLVLREFEECGRILAQVTGSDAANWVNILYQNQIDAQKALSKCGMNMTKDVILGVKAVRSIKREAPNEERIKKHSSEPTQQEVDPERIVQAYQGLRILDRFGNVFFVLGETGNVYTVVLYGTPSCNCPDLHTPCKHMVFVFLRVLGISPHDCCLQSKTLTQCQVGRIGNMRHSVQSFADACVRNRFRYLRRTMSIGSRLGPPQKIQLEIGEKCPYCEGDLNEADVHNPVVECEACGEVGHESCLVTSKMRQGGYSCKSCRAPWSALSDENRYLNLAAYISEVEDDQVRPRRRQSG